jgi:thiamine-phosphate pyrophosphorylase
MSNLWRIIDVEYNRVTEGLRVLEDLARFYWENTQITIELKSIRSKIAHLANGFHTQLLLQRDAENDLGMEVSQKLRLDFRNSLVEMATANFKRVQEGLRSLEEHLKVLDYYDQAKEFELLRYQVYHLEKAAAFQSKTTRQFPQTDLYAITASEYSLGRSNLEVVKQLLEAEIKVIQYREKDLPMLQKYRECVKIRELTTEYGAAFIVNDDLHLALAVKADGVHLGQDDLPVEQARELTQGQMLIGLSTHSSRQADLAVKAGVDYIGVGPLFRTFTKKNVCEPVGLAYLDYVVSHHQIPFVAIGGIKKHNIGEVIRHGAQCIALVTEIVGAEDIAAKIKELRREINQTREEMP